jgi:NAD(P)-dependent dehydrogenase (short-subunit alcohol dehydrogenase family)
MAPSWVVALARRICSLDDGNRMANWTVSDIPSQRGRTAVITGTGGLGFQDALALARAGANVIIGGRNSSKGEAAVAQIHQSVPDANVCFEPLDLASLDSIRAFSERVRQWQSSLDLLINNAAVMTPPKRQVTSDGFELQFGTNYLGHFALTGRLLPLLRKGNTPRVVTVSSVAARSGALDFDDLQSERSYQPMSAYRQSKLACLVFAFELQRRCAIAGWDVQSIASHPGVSRTDLLPNGAGLWSAPGMARRFLWFLFQPAAQGALPTLFAATSMHAHGGGYYGPDKFNETRGYPTAAKVPPQALDTENATRLWTESERLIGVALSIQNGGICESQTSPPVQR